jgi:hypothetical protein
MMACGKCQWFREGVGQPSCIQRKEEEKGGKKRGEERKGEEKKRREERKQERSRWHQGAGREGQHSRVCSAHELV